MDCSFNLGVNGHEKTNIYNSFEYERYRENRETTSISDELNRFKSMKDNRLMNREEFTRANKNIFFVKVNG